LDYVMLDCQPCSGAVGLRELRGHDEQMVTGTGTMMAVRLLDRLLEGVGEVNARPLHALGMTAADRDKLLAAVYLQTYGARIESTVGCLQCGVPFDIDFSLTELQASVVAAARKESFPQGPGGYFLLPDGSRFRLPTGEDECAVLGLAPDAAAAELLKRCLAEEHHVTDPADALAAMAGIAPLLDIELTGRCPECENEQGVHFDIQTFLLKSLEQEKSRLAWEVHRLACAYGWSLGEILGLPRSLRRTYVALVESEVPSRRRFSL
jgi:hypothetical protein